MFYEDTPQQKISATERFKRHNSILDVVMDQAKSLNRELGKQDQRKLEEYFDSVRTLEGKIQQQEPWINRPKPKAPVDEPKPGNGTAEQLKAMIEIIALALQTDSTRAITCVSGFANGDFGLNGGYHGFSHHGEREEPVAALKKIEGYQVSMMSYLIDLLKAQEDPINGGTLLDHTSILYGCGMATGGHSTRNLPSFWPEEASSTASTRFIPGLTSRTSRARIGWSARKNAWPREFPRCRRPTFFSPSCRTAGSRSISSDPARAPSPAWNGHSLGRPPFHEGCFLPMRARSPSYAGLVTCLAFLLLGSQARADEALQNSPPS